MKKPGILLMLVLVIFSCKSPEKLLQEGNYDEAIDRSIKKLQKGNAKDEDKVVLDRAYRLAQERDQSRITFLREENKPENWEEIYMRLSGMSARQEKLQRVQPLTIKGKRVNFRYVDYNADIIEAKTNAAKYFYERGVALMDMDTREGYREAFYNFQKVRNYRASDYPELDQMMDDALYYGTSRVLIDVENRLPYRLPADFFREVHSINTDGLNGNWVEYHLAPLSKDTYYDYYIDIILNNVIVEPPATESNEYVRTKRVRDGEEPKRDGEGNIVHDADGKVVNVPRYKELECKVYEIKQIKTVTVTGEIHYLSADPKSLIRKVPVAGSSVFEVVSGRAVGDREALLPEDLEIIKREKVPFPEDMDMIMDCAPILRDAITDAIRNNRNAIY